MKKVLVTYYSRSGNTAEMARMVADGLTEKGLAVTLKQVEEVNIDSLPDFDGFVIGSPNYFGTMAWPVKKFVDESVKCFKKLDGKAVATGDSGPALTDSRFTVTRQDLFQLLAGVSPGYHLIDLTVPAGFRIYTFTFG